jgi:hypothetical protein
MTFTEEIRALYGQYKQDIKVIRDESTLEIFSCILRQPSNQVRGTNVLNMQIGKFYVIQYDYNGNKLWCPILTIPPVPNKNEKGILEKQLKIVNNKNILYAINFDYLPLAYKIALIDAIIRNNQGAYDKNSDKIFNKGKVREESCFRIDWIYNYLKNKQNKVYSITAFDISKILKVFEISSTILHRFIFIDTLYINRRMMYDTLETIQNENLRVKFSDKIKLFEEILKLYETDIETFYKALRSFEKNLKLIDNI